MTRYKNWMPLWLATYIFLIGWTILEILVDMFIFMACEHDIHPAWYYGPLMFAILSLPWIWYFTYLGNRYFYTIPRMWYVLIFAPMLEYASVILSMKTIYCSGIFTFNGQIHYIHIGADNLLYVALVIFMLYEVFMVWQKRLADRNLYIPVVTHTSLHTQEVTYYGKE